MRIRTLLVLALVGLSATDAAAQDPDEAEIAAQEFESQLDYQRGAITLGDGLATLHVPPEFRFLGPDDAYRLLVEAWGNPPGEKPLGMLFPSEISPFADEGWGVVITYEDVGFVEDDEAGTLDYDELLRDMQEGTREENRERESAGFPSLEIVGWAAPPHYDPDAKKLYWAKELRFGDDPMNTLNYNIRVLGRRGVLVLNAVSSIDQLTPVETGMRSVLGFVDFNDGHRYADFVPGADKVAAFGIGALIAGKVAAKAGLLKVLIAGLVAAKKLVVVAVVAAIAAIRRIFRKKEEAEAAV